MNSKLLIISILVLMAFLYWILPGTKLSRKFKMNVPTFYIMNIIGIIFGALGIAVSLV